MNNGGGLVYIHHHDNLDILKDLSEVDGVLYYKGSPILSGEDLESKSYTEEEIQAMIIDLWTELDENVEFDDNGNVIVDNSFVTNKEMEEYVQEALTKLVNNAVGEETLDEETTEELPEESIDEESGGDTSDAGES